MFWMGFCGPWSSMFGSAPCVLFLCALPNYMQDDYCSAAGSDGSGRPDSELVLSHSGPGSFLLKSDIFSIFECFGF